MKRIVLINTDLKSYWKGRLYFLKIFFANKYIDFRVIEIFGLGSPYSFDSLRTEESWWTCIFPQEDPLSLSKSTIQNSVFKRLDELQPDVVISASIVFVSGALGVRWAKKNNKKAVIFDDSTHSSLKRNFVVNFLKKSFTAQADGFIIPTTYYDNEYTRWGIDKSRLFYGFDCVDNELFKNDVPFEEKKNLITCIARLVPVKNLDRLLMAWAKIEEKRQDFILSIVGEGIERKALEKIISENNLKNVRLVGAKTTSEIVKILSESQGFILPSLSESWGLAVNEAMASGLPVLVSTKVNAGRAIIEEGVTGHFFDPYSIDQISDTMMDFINLPIGKKNLMGKAALQKISEINYSYMASEIHRLANELPLLPDVKPSFPVRILLNRWHGRYETRTWDFLT
jgi:glycosyltransferase involved in cell wall biosynthesis